MAGRPAGVPNKDKPFRDALRMEVALADKGKESPAPKGSLRHIARELLDRAAKDNAAVGIIADRLDGKVPQAVVGDDEHAAIRIDSASDEQRAKALALLMAKTGLGK